MEAKYICGDLPAPSGTRYGAIVFPSFMTHAEVARALDIAPDSAGMCRRDSEGRWYCYGKAYSLGLIANDDDERHLNKLGES